jgi:pimeloyl-ACP methyl ester carboxylesterase
MTRPSPPASALVLLHAAGSSPRALDRLAHRLAPGIGRTVAPPIEAADDAIGAAATRVAALLNGLPDRPRVLFGHSMGGLVALEALARGANAEAVVLYEPIVLSLLDPHDPDDRAALDWDRTVISEFRHRLAAGEAEVGVAGFVEAYGEMRWAAIPPPARAELVRGAASLLALASATQAATLDRAALARLTVPTLLLDGDRSPDVARRMAARLAAILPGAVRVTVPGSGHMGPISAAGEVARSIAAFLGRYGLWHA